MIHRSTRSEYVLNGEEIDYYYPEEYEFDGLHLLHLLYTWSSSANVIGTFVVKLRAAGGSVDIPIQGIHAYMAGQGLVGDGEWDGNVYASDDFVALDMSEVIKDFTAEVTTGLIVEGRDTCSDEFEMPDMYDVLPAYSDSIGDVYGLHRYTAYIPSEWTYEPSKISISDGKFVLNSGQSSATLTTPSRPASQILKVTSNMYFPAYRRFCAVHFYSDQS